MRTRGVVATAVVICVLCGGAGRVDAAPARRVEPVIHMEDVARFYRVYDAAGGHPDGAQLQHDYLDRGSAGLHNSPGCATLPGRRLPQLWPGARSSTAVRGAVWRCMAVLPAVR